MPIQIDLEELAQAYLAAAHRLDAQNVPLPRQYYDIRPIYFDNLIGEYNDPQIIKDTLTHTYDRPKKSYDPSFAERQKQAAVAKMEMVERATDRKRTRELLVSVVLMSLDKV